MSIAKYLLVLHSMLLPGTIIRACLTIPDTLVLEDSEHTNHYVSKSAWCDLFSFAAFVEQQEPIAVSLSREEIELLDATINCAQRPERYSEIVAELSSYRSINSLFEYVVHQLHIHLHSTVCHLLAQAYARAQYRAIEHEPELAQAIINLFAQFNHHYPELAASLNMYVYFCLSTSVRLIVNSDLASHVSAELFLRQIPFDKRVVQFAEYDDFSSLFAHIDQRPRRECFDRAFSAPSYVPFETYFSQQYHLKCHTYDQFATMLHTAFQRRDVVFFDLARYDNPIFFARALKDRTIMGRSGFPLLMCAVLVCHYGMVKYLIDHGANPLQMICIKRCLDDETEAIKITILQNTLALLPDQEVGQDPVFDNICRLLITRAAMQNSEKFTEIVCSDRHTRKRINALLPRFLEHLAIPASCSCCGCC